MVEFSDNLSACKDCGNDCVGTYCNSCGYQRMVDEADDEREWYCEKQQRHCNYYNCLSCKDGGILRFSND